MQDIPLCCLDILLRGPTSEGLLLTPSCYIHDVNVTDIPYFEVGHKKWQKYEPWEAKRSKALRNQRNWHKEKGGKDIQGYDSPENPECNLWKIKQSKESIFTSLAKQGERRGYMFIFSVPTSNFQNVLSFLHLEVGRWREKAVAFDNHSSNN